MTDLAEQSVNRDSLTCSQCQYSLRGLSGEVVACPECGFRCDIVKLIVRRQTGPWYRAPGLNACYAAARWFVISPWVGLFFVVIGSEVLRMHRAVVALVIALIVGVWLVLVRRAGCVFGSWQGVVIALFAHAVLMGYLLGMLGFVGSFLALVSGWNHLGSKAYIPVTLLVAFAFLYYFSRRADRYVAEQCVRKYLRNVTEAKGTNR